MHVNAPVSNSSIRSRQGAAAHPPAPRTSPAPREQREDHHKPERHRKDARTPEAAPLRAGLKELDEPFAYDVRDDAEASPPLRGKVHPRSDLSDAVPTLDDEVRRYHHHPNDAGCIEFEVNPDAADAAADLASDLGSEFLEGATKGQDLSDVVMSHEDDDGDLPYLLEDEELEPSDQDIEPEEEEPPVTKRMRRYSHG